MKKNEGLNGAIVSNTFSSYGISNISNDLTCSMERDYHKRPSPRQLLNSHPWVVGISKREVDMERWIREVWGWPA
jgi:hypothetical protein